MFVFLALMATTRKSLRRWAAYSPRFGMAWRCVEGILQRAELPVHLRCSAVSPRAPLCQGPRGVPRRTRCLTMAPHRTLCSWRSPGTDPRLPEDRDQHPTEKRGFPGQPKKCICCRGLLLPLRRVDSGTLMLRAEPLSGLLDLQVRNTWWSPSRWRTRTMSVPGDINPQHRALLMQPSPAAEPPVIPNCKVKGRSCPTAVRTHLPWG